MKRKKEMLNTLKSIDGTLKRIEQNLNYEKQGYYIHEAVVLALREKKYSPPLGDSDGNLYLRNGKKALDL